MEFASKGIEYMEERALCTLMCAAYSPLYSAAHAQSTGNVPDISALLSVFSGMMPHARCASRKAPYRVDSFTDDRQIGRFNTLALICSQRSLPDPPPLAITVLILPPPSLSLIHI